MIPKLEVFFAKHKILFLRCIGISILVLVANEFFAPEELKKTIAVSSLAGMLVGCTANILFSEDKILVKLGLKLPEKPEIEAEKKTYEQLIEEITGHLSRLKKQHIKVVAYLIPTCVVIELVKARSDLWISNPWSLLGVAVIAFTAVADFEKEKTLDEGVVRCAIEGIKREEKMKGPKPGYFLDFFQRYYEGWRIIWVVWTRVLPRVSIIAFALNTGVLKVLANHIPSWVVSVIAGSFFILMMLFLFLAVYGPYRRLRRAMMDYPQLV